MGIVSAVEYVAIPRNVAPRAWTPRWWYFATVTTAGLGVLLAFAIVGYNGMPELATSVTFWTLVALTILSEVRPVLVMRASEANTVVISIAFVFAALLHLGVGAAVVLHVLGTTTWEMIRRHAPFRVLFNVAVCTLALLAAASVLRLGGMRAAPDQLWLPAAQGSAWARDLMFVAFAIAIYFSVQFLLVCAASALTERIALISVMRRDIGFESMALGTLLGLSPLVVVVLHYAPVLTPLFALPIVAILKQSSALRERDYLAYHDMLTGLPNRDLLVLRTERALAEADRSNTRVALILLDLDRFKEVNDTLGHATGDRILRQVAQRLPSSLRTRDTVARLGGDEFAVLLPSLHESAGAFDIAGRMRTALAAPLKLDGMSFDIDASFGVAVYPDHAKDFESLLQRADVAMYVAKESTRGVEVYAPEIDQNSPVRLALLGRLRRAIECDELELHYQPKALLTDRSVVGVEALVRWNHPERGLIPPDEFIPLAEQSGLVCLLTQWVLETAVAQSAAWARAGLEVNVSVNVSVRDLLLPDFAGSVAAALARHDRPGSSLQLEITERVLMADPDGAAGTLADLAALGVSLSLDDFGTGYSSLVYLQRLTVSEIKVDRSFVQRLTSDDNDRAIVQSIVDLGRSMGLVTVAEGVETEEGWRVLDEMGCEAAQGWWLGKPMPAQAATQWLQAHAADVPEARMAGSAHGYRA